MIETAAAALAGVRERLAQAGCETPEVDAELLLAHVLGTTRSGVLGDRGRPLTGAQSEELRRLVARREQREPLPYVLGSWGFRRLLLNVDSRVLVPRPETEVVVERCLAHIAGQAGPRVLDVGTGSGAIALAIADEHPGAHVTGIDSSPAALEVARANAASTGLGVELVEWDLHAGLPPGPWGLVVSNPPYVRPRDVELLPREVRDWEPRAALVGEGVTEAVATGARDVLEAGGGLVLEVADGDAERVAALLRDLGYAQVTTTRDLTGRERVVDGVRA